MERKTSGGLIIPANVSGVRTEAFRCTLCGLVFYDDELRQYTLHVSKCARAHEQQIQEASLRHQLPGIYGPEAGDPEYERWVKENPAGWFKERKIDPNDVL